MSASGSRRLGARWLTNLFERASGGAVQDRAVGVEAAPVARAIPAAFGAIEVHVAAEVSADG